MDLEQAIEEAGHFLNRERYRQIWVARWKAELGLLTTGADSGSLFAAIERAVAAALTEEEAARKASGDRLLEEDWEYKAFVDNALERLLREGDLGVDS
jgi:hypothetical protein